MAKSLKKNALLNTIKTLCQVVFPLITVPYVAKVLGTGNYGKVNYTASIISYFALFGAFGINNYATREGASIREEKEKLNKLTNELFAINIITSLLAIVLVIMLVFCTDLNVSAYKTLILIQGMSIVFTAVGADWINTIFEDYGYITVRYILVQVVSFILILSLIKNTSDYILYAAIVTFASSGANLFNIFYIRKYVHLRPCIYTDTARHLKPMLILVIYSFAITIYVNSDTTLLGALKGDDDVGIYSLAAKVYLVVKQVLNATIFVAVPRVSLCLEKKDDQAYKSIIAGIFDFLIIIVPPSVVGLFLMADEVIYYAGDLQYKMAVLPLRFLSVSLIFAVFACYYSNCYLLPNRKDKYMLLATVLGCASNFILNLFFIPKYSYVGASITTLIAEMIVLCVCFIVSRKIEKTFVDKKNVLAVAVGCLGIVGVCLSAKKLLSNINERMIVSIIFSVVVYTVLILVFNNKVALECYRRIRIKL